METRNLIVRASNLVLMALLVSGYAALQAFAAVLVWGMVVLALVGILTVDEKAAKTLQDAPVWRLAVAWAFHLGYVGALLLSGRPILAACYFMAAFVLRFTASQKLKANA